MSGEELLNRSRTSHLHCGECVGDIYGGREVQTNITKSETLLQSLRQIYILENIFTYHKTKLHYHNTFTSPETNLHFRKQIYISENKLTRRKTLLQVPKQIYKRH